MFPIITKELQKQFEKQSGKLDETPVICGIYGRVCRQMNNPEGANRFICNGCELAEYAQSKKGESL